MRAIPVIAVLLCAYGVAGCHKKNTAQMKPVETKVPVAEPPAQRPIERAAVQRSTPTPPPVATTGRRSQPTEEEKVKINELLSRIQDAYFDYDKHTIRVDAEKALREDAQTLTTIIRQYPEFKLLVEGHCDERGSDQYNLALGDARANQAKEFLVGLGLPASQLNTVSYGRQKPVCTEADENCWQKNRRAHLTVAENRSR